MDIFTKLFGKDHFKKAKNVIDDKERLDDCLDTSDFLISLYHGQFEKCENWIKKIEDNHDDYRQYREDWIEARKNEIAQYRRLHEDGKLESFPMRTKEQSRVDLVHKFGFSDTPGFRRALERGEREQAQAWFDYIMENPKYFPQYYMNKDWEIDRRRELAN